MPRISRNFYSTKFFHVMTQGINKEYIFNESQDIKYYIKLIYNLLNDYSLKIISYCIMDNHAHILFHINNISELSKYMQRLNLKYGKYYNSKYDRVGYVFRDRFKSEPIYDKKHFYNCIKYIYDNPVKAGLCKNPQDYPYSNYKEVPINMLDNTLTFIDTDEDKEKEYLEEINNFIVKKNVKNLLKNKLLLKELTLTLITKYGLSLRDISRLLHINRESIRKIVN